MCPSSMGDFSTVHVGHKRLPAPKSSPRGSTNGPTSKFRIYSGLFDEIATYDLALSSTNVTDHHSERVSGDNLRTSIGHAGPCGHPLWPPRALTRIFHGTRFEACVDSVGRCWDALCCRA
jgi:hypothetical protein